MNTFYDRLYNYFQSICDDIESGKNTTGIFPTSCDRGDTREDLVMRFFENHIPKRCQILKGGFLFDIDGNDSKQIDLFITNDATLQFKVQRKSFNYVGGVIAAISVKSELNKAHLENALENLASIPRFPDVTNMINPLFQIKDPEFVANLPLKIIFALKGLNIRTAHTHILDYYHKHSIKEYQKPDMVYVNNAYCIQRASSRGIKSKIPALPDIPPFCLMACEGKESGIYALAFMLMAIQRASEVLNQMLLNMTGIISKLPMKSKRLTEKKK